MNYRIYRFFTVLYGFLILGLSSIPSRSFPDIPIWDMDKVIHFAEYLIFGFLLTMGFPGLKRNFIVLLTLSGIAFGAFDEFYQSFIPGRDMDFKDWIADSAGFLSGLGIAVFTRLRNDKTRIN